MNRDVKKVFEDAIIDSEFAEDMIKAKQSNAQYFDRGKIYYFFMSEVEKHVVVAFYYGWLVGKGKDVSKYQ